MSSPKGELYIWFVQHNQGTPISEVIFTHYIYWVFPQHIFFLLFTAMHFCKVQKIINYLPIHLKTCKVG